MKRERVYVKSMQLMQQVKICVFTEIVWLVGEGRHPSPEVDGVTSQGRHQQVGGG